MAEDLPVYTLEELAKHNTPEDAWVGINGYVYDVTDFADGHPGGTGVLLRFAGNCKTLHVILLDKI